MTLDDRIKEETLNIIRLERSYPMIDESVHFYDPKNLPYHIHHTATRDAYWRRRMLIAERDGLSKSETAKVY